MTKSDEEPVSSGDSVVHSLRLKSRRRLTHKEKGKKKIPRYDTGRDESDRSESDSEKNKQIPSETKSESAKRALKSAEQKFRRSTR